MTPEGIPLVKDSTKDPAFWKFPGGHGNFQELPADCAIREVREELGISLRSRDLKVVHSEDRRDHFFTLFVVYLPQLPKLKEEGDEGEEVKVSSPAEILSMETAGDFFPSHLSMAKAILKNLL